MNRSNQFSEHMGTRSFFADRLEAHFKARPYVWISILDLIQIGGPSWRSRIADELRDKRSMDVVWNANNRESAYMYRPQTPHGPDASTPREPLLFDLHPR